MLLQNPIDSAKEGDEVQLVKEKQITGTLQKQQRVMCHVFSLHNLCSSNSHELVHGCFHFC